MLSTQLNQLQGLINKFIWQQKKPRLKQNILLSPVQHGGMGAPNIHAYYKAVILDQLKEWWSPTSRKTWHQIESAAITPNLKHVLTATLLNLKPQRHFLQSTTSALRVWTALTQQARGIPNSILSKLPIQAIEMISPDLSVHLWTQKGLVDIGQLMTTSGIHSFVQLQQLFGIPTSTFFLYLRIRSIISPITILTDNAPMADILKFYEIPAPAQKGISVMYKILTTSSANQSSPSIDFWSSLTTAPPPPANWYKALTLPLRVSRCTSHWESTQKLFHKWYYTPARLAKIYPTTSSQCWRNCSEAGSLRHIWWECPVIHRFWLDVANLLSTICKVPPPSSPLDLLLGLDVPTWPKHIRVVATHILIAARLALARKWKSPQPPLLSDLIVLLNYHFHMEFAFAKANLNTALFLQKWEPWISDSRSTALS